MTQIYFVRHGESEANVQHTVNDNPSRLIRLTARGHEQCILAAAELQNIPFTQAFASEFLRAQETLSELLAHKPLPIQIDARLNEWRTGMDGASIDSFFVQLKAGLPHGESFAAIVSRLRSFILTAQSLYPDGILLVVSHETPLIAAQVAAGYLPLENGPHQIQIPNCAHFIVTL